MFCVFSVREDEDEEEEGEGKAREGPGGGSVGRAFFLPAIRVPPGVSAEKCANFKSLKQISCFSACLR